MSRVRQEHELDAIYTFGAFLATLRAHTTHRVKQKEIVEHLPGWTASSYSRLESGELAPHFDQLPALYRAFQQAGICFTSQTRQQFVDLARKRLALQQTYLDRHTETEWAQLRFALARLDGVTDDHLIQQPHIPKPLLTETTHLIGRDSWRETLLRLIESEQKKLVVVRGPAGIGKSSELNWLATQCFQGSAPFRAYSVLLCDFRTGEMTHNPEDALDLLINSALVEIARSNTQVLQCAREERLAALFAQLERTTSPLLILIDHGEYLLQERAIPAPCWQQFLSSFLRRHHTAKLILATRQWSGWYGGEHTFVEELPLPPLSREVSIHLFQHLGLERVSPALLEKMYQAVGGIPLCLEWVAALVKQPFFLEEWEEVTPSATSADTLTQAVERLLAEPHIFGGALAGDLTPLLERTITPQRLSAEATRLLHALSVATLPLAKPAFQVLCPTGTRPIKELRHASLLDAYTDRVQLLPMVAAAVLLQLSPEQMHEYEKLLLEAYQAWRREGTFHEGEEGKLVTEYAALLLKHEHFMDTAHLLISVGWLSFNAGYGSRLARLVANAMQHSEWHATIEQECGALLLRSFLSPFTDTLVDERQLVADRQYVLEAIRTNKITVRPYVETHIVRCLMGLEMQEGRFAAAQALLDTQRERLKTYYPSDTNARLFLLEKYGLLFGKWGEYAHVQGEIEKARALRIQAIDAHRECIAFLTEQSRSSPAKDFRRRLAFCLNELGYHLNYLGCYEKALQVIEQSISLREQGYTTITGLAESYGEKSQVLAELGRFREALYFDERAMTEIQRTADAGHRPSQEDLWIYYVNRGLLYLRLGRVDDAENLLQKALPYISQDRRIYRMFAEEAQRKIEQWRKQTSSPHHQLDWRWVERFRELAGYDSFWWLAPAGPFTEDEQQQRNDAFTPILDEITKERLGRLIVQSRERELMAAVTEQREPCLHYPAIDIVDVRRRIVALKQLDVEIQQQEPNPIVRRLYHGAIGEDVDFLSLIEATYESDSDKYWACNLRLLPLPAVEEMEEVLTHIRCSLNKGLQRPETAELSRSIHEFMRTQFQISLDLSMEEEVVQQEQPQVPRSPASSQRKISAQTAKRFYEAVLQENGFEGWRVMIDPTANGLRVEHGLRQLFLPDQRLTLTEIRENLVHELGGHAARSVAGDHSPLGLLGIHTRNSLPTEEGLILYKEIQTAALHGQTRDVSGLLLGTFAIGLAVGIMTPPQTFLPICTFIESFSLLRRILNNPGVERERLHRLAREYAFSICLRAFRGVPDLQRAGICYLQDTVYIHGLHLIERAVAQDATVLDRLAVGVVALEDLPDLQELGIVSALPSISKFTENPELDKYILSFDEPEEQRNKGA